MIQDARVCVLSAEYTQPVPLSLLLFDKDMRYKLNPFQTNSFSVLVK